MQSEVLRYECEDYKIYILTNDNIFYPWEKFQGRIGVDVASTYCRYTSSSKGMWQLYDYDDKCLKVPSDLEHAKPVIFETNKYHICIYFSKGITTPRVLHVRKDVERWFSEDPLAKDSEMPKLEGDADFLNEPGVFKLQVEYTKSGKLQNGHITFDVVSPKMDTKEDYKSLLAVVNREYENVIFRYLSTTYQQFTRGKVNNDQIWLSSFEQVIEKYIQGIKTIIHSPHTKMTKQVEFAKAEHIKHWTAAMEEKYKEIEAENRLETYYFRYEQYIRQVDSLENRFVKHTLLTIGKKLVATLSKIQESFRAKEEFSENYATKLNNYKNELLKLQKHPFFKSIGKFEGLANNSLVLQSRQGYMQVYKAWILLRRGIEIYSGKANIGTLQIWEIYELWCFIKMKQLVQEVVGVDEANYEKLVKEPKGSMLNAFSNTKLEYVVEYTYPEDSPLHGDVVSLHYQHTFNRRNQDDYNIHTATTEQRPDIVLNIKKADSDQPLLTYLYDAKYRVWNDKALDLGWSDKDEEYNGETDEEEQNALGIKGADYPPSDAINQMHRYRDAIYYGSEIEKQSNKEVIGGYVLFPGRGDKESIANRYYQKSMQTVNIGAIPLLPMKDSTKEGSLLREHLTTILKEKVNVIQHVKDAIPQRGLYYTDDASRSIANTSIEVVLVNYANNEHWQLYIDKKMCYVRLGDVDGSISMPILPKDPKYLLLHNSSEHQLFELATGGAKILSTEQLQGKGFTPSQEGFYLCYAIKSTKPVTDTNIDVASILKRGQGDIPPRFEVVPINVI